jgi:hypothetical protein
MNHDKAAPKFMKPGDDPELDRLLDEARGKESEPPGEYYYDMFGRRRRVPAVDPHEKSEKGPEAGVVTETRPATAPPQRQTRWLALGALAIVGPVVALALGAFQSGKGAQGARIPSPDAASAAARVAAVMIDSGAPAPTMIAAPALEEDAGAAPAVTATPTGSGGPAAPAPVKPKHTKGRGEDPYEAPAPGPAKPVVPVVPVVPAPLPPSVGPSPPPPIGGDRVFGN